MGAFILKTMNNLKKKEFSLGNITYSSFLEIRDAIRDYKELHNMNDWDYKIIDKNNVITYENGIKEVSSAIDIELTDPMNPMLHIEARVFI